MTDGIQNVHNTHVWTTTVYKKMMITLNGLCERPTELSRSNRNFTVNVRWVENMICPVKRNVALNYRDRGSLEIADN